MKTRVQVAALLLLPLALFAQRPGNTQWTASVQATSIAGEYVIALHGTVEKGWHVYSAKQVEGGPLPLVIRVDQGAPFALHGALSGTQPTKHHDASFNLDTEYFTDTFVVNVPVKAAADATGDVPLAVRFQMCSDTTCMPPRTVHVLATIR